MEIAAKKAKPHEPFTIKGFCQGLVLDGVVGRLCTRWPWLRRKINRYLIDEAIVVMDPRPYRLSAMDDFTSWDSLTDRTYSARELPRSAARAGQPPPERVLALFERDTFIASRKSTVLFSYVAQWFTDGFMRTPRLDEHGYLLAKRDLHRNDSTHHVDLAQVYGPNKEVTELLRDGHRLACQKIDGEEYPPALFEIGEKDFTSLPTIGAKEMKRPDEFLAMASDAANTQIGYAMLNTLFLRAHNTIADEIAANHRLSPRHVFNATRNVLTVLTIKLVIEQYINHITPWRFRFRFDRNGFEKVRWHRQNWMAVEFNLLYRWHCLIPDQLRIHGQDLDVEKTTFRTRTLLTDGAGLGELLDEASSQPAGAIELFNTGSYLLERGEKPTIVAARDVGVATYNDYREHCGFERVRSFEHLSSDEHVIDALKDVYKTVDDVEFYPGLYAEDRPRGSVVGPLMGRLVAVHAFSQLLTNPLLAPSLNGEHAEATFTRTGLDIIDRTESIQCVVDLVGIKGCDARLTHKTWTQ